MSVFAPTTGLTPFTAPTSAAADPKASASNQKAQQAAKEFESILLSQWMQGAQQSFGTVPASDEEQDACSEQLNSFATQSLAKHLGDVGGLGLGKMVSSALNDKAVSSPTHRQS